MCTTINVPAGYLFVVVVVVVVVFFVCVCVYLDIYIVQTPLIYSLALPPIEPSGGTHDDSCVLLLE